jgi:hypothetical protein
MLYPDRLIGKRGEEYVIYILDSGPKKTKF